MNGVWRKAMRIIENLDIQEWMLVLLVAVAIGVFCMRGFGSRTNY